MTSPLFSGLAERAAGVLLHPTSLPSRGGIGCLDEQAGRFARWLARAGFTWWQMCPVGPTGYGDSPYSPFSAFAGNPYLIDLHALALAGLLEFRDLEPLDALPRHTADFGWLYHARWPVLRKAAAAFARRGRPTLAGAQPFAEFAAEQAAWLPAFALFMALKGHFDGRPAAEWPAGLESYAQARAHPIAATVAAEADAHQFYQYAFLTQWRAFKAEANALGVRLLGDLPIYVAADSADVWTFPHYFDLDAHGRPAAVAGVPPDYFSADGQLWGNPLYDWKRLRRDGFSWWLDRLRANFALFDAVRLDHFRGFASYWRVPPGAASAKAGAWAEGPGEAFFKAVAKAFPDAPLIAEDLGEITPDVRALLARTGLPGMAILQFAFDGQHRSVYLPHHQVANQVVYTGTHDNDTSRGWYESAPEPARDQVRRYLGVDGRDLPWDLVRAAYRCPARLAVVPAQDLLGLGTEARFNAPGTVGRNWAWRLTGDQLAHLEHHATAYLRSLGQVYQRLPAPPAATAMAD